MEAEKTGPGGTSIPRALQVSHWFVANKLQQLKTIGPFTAAVFLGVAAGDRVIRHPPDTAVEGTAVDAR